MFFNTWATIPLPEKAVFVKGGDRTVTYDAATHSVKIYYGNFWQWQAKKYFTLKYSNVAVGERVQGGDMIFSGMEGNTIPRQFVYSGINNVISPDKLQVGLTLYHSLSDIGYGTYIPGMKDSNFYHLSIRNIGNVPVRDAEMTWNLPDGLQGRSIRVPSSSQVNIANWSSKLILTYISNQGRTLTKSFSAPLANTLLGPDSLGLYADEYFTTVKVKWESFNPGDFNVVDY